MLENIKLESTRWRREGNYSFPKEKIEKAVAQGLTDEYPIRGGWSVPIKTIMSHRQLRNIGGKKLKKLCNRYNRRNSKQETENELDDFNEQRK